MNPSKEAAGQCPKDNNPTPTPPVSSIPKNNEGSSSIASTSALPHTSPFLAKIRRAQTIARFARMGLDRKIVTKIAHEHGLWGEDEIEDHICKYYLGELDKLKSELDELFSSDDDTSSTDVSEDEESEEDSIDEGMKSLTLDETESSEGEA